jgi:hypothetical protein
LGPEEDDSEQANTLPHAHLEDNCTSPEINHIREVAARKAREEDMK